VLLFRPCQILRSPVLPTSCDRYAGGQHDGGGECLNDGYQILWLINNYIVFKNVNSADCCSGVNAATLSAISF
jgi:hypothetical protein